MIAFTAFTLSITAQKPWDANYRVICVDDGSRFSRECERLREALGRAKMNVGLVPPVPLELSTEPIVMVAPGTQVLRRHVGRRGAPRGRRPLRSRPGMARMGGTRAERSRP